MRALLIMIVMAIASPAWAEPLHAPWDRLLKTYVSAADDGVNRFEYKAVTSDDRAALQAYLKALEATQVSELPRDAQMAFWINLYNALTVEVVLEAYPVGSIREIKNGLFSIGPWGKELVTVEGRELSLNDIEHETLRKQWDDPRIHYAVNCASWSCPNLAARAYTAETLEAMLEEGARDYVNHPRGVWFDQGRLQVSSIYRWYKEDFGDTDEGVIAHLKIYAAPELKSKLDTVDHIAGTDYDWTLNAPGKAKGDW